MEKELSSSIIKGFVFCIHDELGPQPKYVYPQMVPDIHIEPKSKKRKNLLSLTFRDYMQIAIKNLSLLLTDEIIPDRNNIKEFKYFAIIPYPDFNLTSLTYFHYLQINTKIKPIETAFSILIDENKRNFLYNNYKRIQNIVESFFDDFDKILIDGFLDEEEVRPFFKKFIKDLIQIEKQPITPASTQRKMKIILAGLDDSGKTSFLLTVDRKFSKLMRLKPTRGASVQSIQALGASLILWDLGGQSSSRDKYLVKSDIYLYETDLIFYFIDIKNKERFKESLDYLKNINNVLEKELDQNTPMVFIFSKGDMDILESKEIKQNIKNLKSQIANLSTDKKFDFYITSIFEITTILRAFSSGISKLSPNRDLIIHNLKKFSKKTDVYITLLLSDDGLVIADFYSYKAGNLMENEEKKEILQDIFEITAPQFTMLYKIFHKFKALKKDKAIFKLANSFVLIKKLDIFETNLHILFLVDTVDKKEKIDRLLIDFTNRIKDLLLTYIS